LAVNPAYAGSRDALTLTLLHRSQWVGFKGAPQTQTFTMHTPLKRDDMGIGLSVVNDRIGPVSTTSFFGDYAYKIPLSKGKLSMGIKGGIDLLQASLIDLSAIESEDNALSSNVRNRVLPNVGVGAYYSLDKFYIGVSCPKLIENNLYDNATSSRNAVQRRHYYAIAGAMIPVMENLEFKPMSLLKMTESSPLEVDFTLIAVIDHRIEVGAMLRTADAIGVLFGINFNNNLRLGYSFDWSTGVKTAKYNAGSHEIMLRYDFISNVRRKITSPRNF
jgi:type IX secretion system PorP/SprF family membrane protein